MWAIIGILAFALWLCVFISSAAFFITYSLVFRKECRRNSKFYFEYLYHISSRSNETDFLYIFGFCFFWPISLMIVIVENGYLLVSSFLNDSEFLDNLLCGEDDDTKTD